MIGQRFDSSMALRCPTTVHQSFQMNLLSTATLAFLFLSFSESMLVRPRHNIERMRRPVKADLSRVFPERHAVKLTPVDDAIVAGDSEKALALLKESLSPTEDLNKAIWEATLKGMTEVVKELVVYHGVNPATSNNALLKAAIKFGHFDIVKFLLSDDRVPVIQTAFIEAILTGDEEMVLDLINHPSFNPSYARNLPLFLSVKHNLPKVFKRLVKEPSVLDNQKDMIRALIAAYYGVEETGSYYDMLQQISDAMSKKVKSKLVNADIGNAIAILYLRSNSPAMVDWEGQTRGEMMDEIEGEHLNSEDSADLIDVLMPHFIQDFVDFGHDMIVMNNVWERCATAYGPESIFSKLLELDSEKCRDILIIYLREQVDIDDLAKRGFDLSCLERVGIVPRFHPSSSSKIEDTDDSEFLIPLATFKSSSDSSYSSEDSWTKSSSSSDSRESGDMDTDELIRSQLFGGDKQVSADREASRSDEDSECDLEEEERKLAEEEAELARLEAEFAESDSN